MTVKIFNRKSVFVAFIIIIASLFSCSNRAPYTYHIPEKMGDGWATATLAEAGIDPKKINLLIQDIEKQKFENLDSVLLVKDGKLVLEEYFGKYGPNTLHELHSVSKSITSILIGIALDRGMLLDVDAKVYVFFPDYTGTLWVDEKYDISLKHLLMMSAGIDWDEFSRPLNDPRNDVIALINSENWIKYVLNKKVVEPPGQRWSYSGGLSLLLGGIIKNASGLYADKFAEKYLFGPLGIVHYAWHRHPDGTINTQGGLGLTPRDMAKIGYLMLRNGQWKGRQIVSKKWIDESTKGHIKTGSLDYGYQWYRGGGVVNGREFETLWAWGLGGQLIFVFPSLDLVAVFTSHPYDNEPGLYRPFTMLGRYILPAMVPISKQRKNITLIPSVLDEYVGQYTWNDGKSAVGIFRKGNTLYSRTPPGEVLKLTPESKDVFTGTSREIKDFTVIVRRDETGKIRGATLCCFPFVRKQLKKID